MVYHAKGVKNEIEDEADDGINQHEHRHQLDGLPPVGSFELPESAVLLPHQAHPFSRMQCYDSVEGEAIL